MNGFITYNSIRKALSQQRKDSLLAGLEDPYKIKGSFAKANNDLYKALKELPPDQQKKFKKLESKKKEDRVNAGLSFITEYYYEESKHEVKEQSDVFQKAVQVIDDSDRNYWNLQEIINDLIVHTAGIDKKFAHTQNITVIHTEDFPPDVSKDLTDFQNITIRELAGIVNNEPLATKDSDQILGDRPYHDTVVRINRFVRNEEGKLWFGGSGYVIYELDQEALNRAELMLVLRWTIKTAWSLEKEEPEGERKVIEKIVPEPEAEPETEITIPASKEKLKQELRLLEAETDRAIRKIERESLLEEKAELEKEVKRLEIKVENYEKKGKTARAEKYENRIDEYEDRISDIMKKLKT